METQNSVQNLSNTFGMLASTAFADVEKQAKATLDKVIADAQHKVELLSNQLPVMAIKINDRKIVKLKNRAVPYLDRLIINAKTGLNTLLVGPAGCGKTTAAKQLADCMELQFGSVCLTAGASETWLFGRQTPNGFVEGSFSKIYKEGGVFLADEMDAADANLLLSINTALANGIMFNPMSGETIHRHKDFVFVGAANTFGKGADHIYTGRNRLDGATIDRFITIIVGYDKDYEKLICTEDKIYNFLSKLRQTLLDNDLEEFISTRWFDYSSRLYENGISPNMIRDTIKSNWCDEAKRQCDKLARTEMSGLRAKATPQLIFETKDASASITDVATTETEFEPVKKVRKPRRERKAKPVNPSLDDLV